MGELFAGWRFVPRRMWSSWRLLLVTAVGVLVAGALLAAVPIYSTALSDMGLQFRLVRTLDDSLLNTIDVGGLTAGDGVDVARRTAVNDVFDARVAWLGEGRLVEERSGKLNLYFDDSELLAARAEAAAAEATDGDAAASDDGAAAGESEGTEAVAEDAEDEIVKVEVAGTDGSVAVHQNWNAFIYRLSDFERHVTVTDGRMPNLDSGVAEAVLLDGFQPHALLGDVVSFNLRRFDDCESLPADEDTAIRDVEVRCQPSAFTAQTINLTVVGFVRPTNPTDTRWEMYSGDLTIPTEPLLPHISPGEVSNPTGGPNIDISRALAGTGSMPLFLTEAQLLGPFGEAAPFLSLRYRVGMNVDVRALTLGDVDRGIDSTRLVSADIDTRLGLAPVMAWPVGAALSQFRNAQSFQQVPLLIILLQVVGIVLYYVAVVASMLVEREAEELSVLRSRGASTAQLVGIYLMEGVLIAAAAAVVAPWLAGQGVAALGYTPTFSILTDGNALPVTVSPSAYLLAVAGAVLALIAILIPAYASSRRAIIDTKTDQARPPGRNVIQRYYLDFAVVGLAGILLWQLDQRGTVFDPDAVGGWSSDPLLLAAPLVFTAAVAALVLRFYPPLLRRTVSILLTIGGTAVALGLRRTGRAPAAYARLILLLIMAISVGTFAASYGPTVDQSQSDRVLYSTGVDLRSTLQTTDRSRATSNIDALRGVRGVDDAALVFRGKVRTTARSSVQVLGVDPERTSSMLWFREDFADEPLPELMRRIQSAVPSGGGRPALSADTTAIKVSLMATNTRSSSGFWARFRDARGNYVNTKLTNIDFEGWREFVAPLPAEGERPLTFVGFRITETQGNAVPKTGALHIDSITAVRGNGSEELIEDFERESDRFLWSLFGGPTANEDFVLSTEEAAKGTTSAMWSWPTGQAAGRRYLLIDDPNVPVAAIINSAAAAAFRVDPGVAVTAAREGRPLIVTAVMEDMAVTLSLRAVVDMFPTLGPELPLAVVNIEHLSELARLIDRKAYLHPTEVWVSTDRPLDGQVDLLHRLNSSQSPISFVVGIHHQDAELEEVRADPTLRASGSGILLAAFTAVLGLAMLGFLVSLVLGARARAVEFAVLRAVGSSRLQVLRSMVLEWGVVLVIGVAIGVLLGRRLAQVMLSFLDVTEEGTKVIPPFTVQTDWITLGAGVGALTAVAVLGLLIAWVSSVRSDTTTELRLTR